MDSDKDIIDKIIVDQTREYYSKVLNKSSDLKTNACCTTVRYPDHIIKAFKNINDEILSTYYGCGIIIPDCIENMNIVDLGCGTGRDVYLLGQLVGENGSVLGIDMTREQLDIAEKYLQTSDPKLRNCLAFYHPQNPFPAAASQNWHRDQEDKKILKIFIYYNKVDKDNGAVWYVRGSAYGGKNSHIWPNMHGGSANLDVSATNKIPPEDIVSFEGPPGTVCFFDSNGFHRGGRVTTGSRIATHACYLAPTAPHIVNNVLGSFEYNKDEINALDKQSAEYQLLSDRQKRVLE